MKYSYRLGIIYKQLTDGIFEGSLINPWWWLSSANLKAILSMPAIWHTRRSKSPFKFTTLNGVSSYMCKIFFGSFNVGSTKNRLLSFSCKITEITCNVGSLSSQLYNLLFKNDASALKEWIYIGSDAFWNISFKDCEHTHIIHSACEISWSAEEAQSALEVWLTPADKFDLTLKP